METILLTLIEGSAGFFCTFGIFYYLDREKKANKEKFKIILWTLVAVLVLYIIVAYSNGTIGIGKGHGLEFKDIIFVIGMGLGRHTAKKFLQEDFEKAKKE